MRLSEEHCRAIKQMVCDILGKGTTVMLFGSRLDDKARGGDVDVFVAIDYTPKNIAWMAASLAVKLERVLDGRKVDVVLHTPLSTHQRIYDQIKEHGMVL